MKLYDLKVNYQKNPIGIDLHAPVFSWSPENLIIGKCWYVMIPENWWALKSPSVFWGIYDGFKKCFKECPGNTCHPYGLVLKYYRCAKPKGRKQKKRRRVKDVRTFEICQY